MQTEIRMVHATTEQIIQRQEALQNVLKVHFLANVESVQTEGASENPIRMLSENSIDTLIDIAVQLVLGGVYEFWLVWDKIEGEDKRIGLKYQYDGNQWKINIPSQADNSVIEKAIQSKIYQKHANASASQLAPMLSIDTISLTNLP